MLTSVRIIPKWDCLGLQGADLLSMTDAKSSKGGSAVDSEASERCSFQVNAQWYFYFTKLGILKWIHD